MIQIDGSFGEGGGQIVRTSLALSVVTGTPFCICNIRAGRKKPGLMRQHLTAVNAAAQISDAETQGNELGSRSFIFNPGPVKTGRFQFAIGTAGSCTLVLQTVLPALLRADGPSELILEGGTHNPYAPPFDFLAKSFLPLLSRMGATVWALLERPGFYPAGGGRFQVGIGPAQNLKPIELLERGSIHHKLAHAVVSNLPISIAQRELKVISEELKFDQEELKASHIATNGPGNVLTVEIKSDALTEVFTGFGQRGVSAEKVAAGLVKLVQEYLNNDVPVGRYLADQILIPLALAGEGRFRTLSPTLHTTTNIAIIKKFLDLDIQVTPFSEQGWEVQIRH